MRAIRLLAAASCLALAVAGCGGGGGPSAQDVLAPTAANLGKVHSGTLGVKLLVTPSGQAAPFGFELLGPFTLGNDALPVARIAYTQIANGQRATATLVSNGTDAYVESGGKRIALSPAQLETLRRAARQLNGAAGGARVAVGSWVKDAKASDGGEVGGAATDKVTGQLDVPQAVGSLVALARLSGRNVGRLTTAETKRLADAVRSSSFVLYSGKRDRLLRKLALSVDLGFDVPPDLKAALGSLVGAKLDFELALTNPRR